MSLAALHHTADTSDYTLAEGQMDIHVRQAVARMVSWCEKQPNGAAFLARGMVVDTLGDITRQINDYFPAHIDTTAIIDDMSFVVAQNARESGQRFQELELAYIGDGKIPQSSQANLQNFVKWYSVENTLGGDFGGHQKHLKPGWSGGAGGSGADMLRHLNLGTKKGFLLQVNALDIKDAKAQTLLAHLDVVQAFGGSPAAVAAAVETIAKGGPEAVTMQGVITQMVEIKQLRAALASAENAPLAKGAPAIDAAPIAAALAMKTESISAAIASIQNPAVVKSDASRSVETVKIDLAARQIDTVITSISKALPAAIVGRAANTNTVSNTSVTPTQISRAVAAVEHIARTNNMTVRELITRVMTKTASPELAAPVKAMTALMAKADFLPVLERAVPVAISQPARMALTAPILQAVSQTPVAPASIIQTLNGIAVKMDIPTLRMASAAVAASVQPVAIEAVAPALRAPALQAVVENLQAVGMTRAVPEAMRPALAVATAQVETLAVQARTPLPQPQPAIPQPLPSQAPLAMMATATQIAPPASIPPSSVRVQVQSEIIPAASVPALTQTAPAPVIVQSPVQGTAQGTVQGPVQGQGQVQNTTQNAAPAVPPAAPVTITPVTITPATIAPVSPPVPSVSVAPSSAASVSPVAASLTSASGMTAQPVVSGSIVSGPVVSGPVVSGPVVSGPVVSGPVVSGPVVPTASVTVQPNPSLPNFSSQAAGTQPDLTGQPASVATTISAPSAAAPVAASPDIVQPQPPMPQIPQGDVMVMTRTASSASPAQQTQAETQTARVPASGITALQETMRAPAGATSTQGAAPAARAADKSTQAAKADVKDAGPGCGGKLCVNCFTKACTATQNFDKALKSAVKTDVLAAYAPKPGMR